MAQYPQPPPPMQGPPAKMKDGGLPWWGVVLIVLGVLVVGSFAGCGACVYCTNKALEPGPPGCNANTQTCRACCAKENRTGGYIDHRRTRMNGARYNVCVCN